MKDYSRFIKSAYGFIINYTIENNEILVYTSKTKKGEPHRYPDTPEYREFVESRLENQYKLIIEHLEEIVEYNRKRKMFLYKALNTVLVALLIIIFILFGGTLVTGISLLSMIAISGTTLYSINKSDKDFISEIKDYERFIKYREDMEQKLECDNNLTKHLSEQTLSMIEEKKQLKAEGKVDSVFNIELMDKVSLEDLRNMLLRYKISESLEEEQTFYIPGQKENQGLLTSVKKRTLTKEE